LVEPRSQSVHGMGAKPGDDDKMRASTRNIAHRSFLTRPPTAFFGRPPKAAGTVSPRSWAGKMSLGFWKCGSANEEVQRLAVQMGKFLEFDHKL